jgi:hypothetical protein
MKTQRECHEALCAGKTLIDQHGALSEYNEDGVLVLRPSPDSDWERHPYLFSVPENWAIYEEPKPKVTYDDAVAAREVLIYWPSEGDRISPAGTYTKEGSRWTGFELAVFDLADRKGYRMEVVELLERSIMEK